ncbi:DMT family transporter [uncultured Sunxiuqinia sp.]|uniref:DMT family transporter n=1 Tax=uncultured Sunxiuqinia sp. TaxID=1573825 RepID=UPI002AA602DA|nr:DMT family transporter [uncultured Sunxiuqinia sp.]
MKNLFSNTIFLAIVACLLWSSAFVGVKIGLQYHTPFQFAGVRFTLSGLMLFFFFNSYRKYMAQIKEHWRFISLIGLLQTVIQYMFFYSGINLLPASIAALIIGSSPLFISVVSHFSFQNDKMNWLKTISILLGVVGVAIISLGRRELPSGVKISLLGIALLLANNFVSGFSNVLVAKKPARLTPIVLSSSSLFFGGIGLIIISIPVEGYGIKSLAPEYFVALAWLSFLSAAAFTIWFGLLQRPGVKVSVLNTWKFLVPVAGAMLSWMIIPDESPDLISIAGMLVIASSLLLLNYSNRKAARLERENAKAI